MQVLEAYHKLVPMRRRVTLCSSAAVFPKATSSISFRAVRALWSQPPDALKTTSAAGRFKPG